MEQKFKISFDEKQVLKKLIAELDRTCKRNEVYIINQMISFLKLDLEDFNE